MKARASSGGGTLVAGGGGTVAVYTPIPEDLQLAQESYRLATIAGPYANLLGDTKWLEGQPEDEPVFESFIAAFRADADALKGTGLIISASNRAALLAMPLPKQLSAADVNKLVDRWNRSINYYNAQIYTFAQVPTGQSTDFIALDALGNAAKAASAASAADVADGNLAIFDGVTEGVQAEKSAIFGPQSAGTCARVKIKLDQTVAITRTAFKAKLQLDNAVLNVPLSHIKVTLKVTDLAGNDQTSLFVISQPTTTGFQAVDGTGTLATGTSGVATWTILPTQAAAANGTTQYFVAGEIDYAQSGTTLTIPLYPTGITVNPDPFLQLHYFLQRDVYSDDPFTPQIEPAEPFSLGLLVVNSGKGAARNMTITSSQPKIIENDKGLLIGFKLIGTQVNTGPVSPSLTVNLGDIAPDGGTAVADFILTASLAGKFVAYNATFKHTDALGNDKTSLIDTVDIHALVHVVRIDTPMDDGKPDFLYSNLPNAGNLPDHVFSSDGTSLPVGSVLNATTDATVSNSNLVVHLTVPTPPTSWIYVRLPDPAAGNFQLMSVVRSDGRVIRLGDNAWTTNREIHLQGQAPYQETRLYLFDKDSTGSYTITYTQNAPILAPVGGLKALSDGTNVQFGDTGAGASGSAGSGTVGAGAAIPVVVTASFSDALYVENIDRSAGMKIIPESGVAIPSVGDIVTGSGVLRTDPNGERYVDVTALTTVGVGEVQPLGMTTKPLFSGDFFYNSATGAGQKGMAGGSGLNVIGEYIRMVGQVQGSGNGSFTLSDGFGKTATVLLPSGASLPTVGTAIGVTGIVSVLPTPGGLTPLLRPRSVNDLSYDLSSLQETYTSPGGLLHVGDNLFSLPGIPLNPAPPSVLAGIGPADGSGLIGRLSRYDAPSQSEVFWDIAGTQGQFGNLLLNEGYRLHLNTGDPQTVSFSGLRSNFADVWVSLPKLGATRIGDPFNAPIDWASVQVNDGTRLLSMRDAAKNITPNWINSVGQFFDSVGQKSKKLGLPEDSPDSAQLMPWLGYWIYSLHDQLALVVPAPIGQATPPTLSSISPSTLPAGSPQFTLLVSGSNFDPQATLDWNGQPRATIFVSTSRLKATIPASDVATQGSAPVLITVVNPAGKGGVSDALPLTITSATSGSNKPPTVSLTAPANGTTVTAPANVTLTATATDAAGAITQVQFYRGATLVGTAMTSPYSVTLTSLTAGIYTLTAKAFDNHALSATSSAITLTVTNAPAPVPTIAKLSPNSATAGATDTPLTITGTGFLPGSHVAFNQKPLTPIGVSSDGKTITATIPAGLLVSAGSVSVTVTNDPTSGGGGGQSGPAAFTINAPPLSLTSLSQSTAAVQAAGSQDLLITLTGKSFAPNAVAHWKASGTGTDTALSTTSVSITSLQARIPASLLGAIGSANITVVNPAPNSAVSNAAAFAVGTPTILLTTVTFSRDASRNIQATVTLTNTSVDTVTNLLLTKLTLIAKSGTYTVSNLSIKLGTGTVLVTFPNTSGVISGTVARGMTAAGSYSGGGFSSSKTLSTTTVTTQLP